MFLAMRLNSRTPVKEGNGQREREWKSPPKECSIIKDKRRRLMGWMKASLLRVLAEASPIKIGLDLNEWKCPCKLHL